MINQILKHRSFQHFVLAGLVLLSTIIFFCFKLQNTQNAGEFSKNMFFALVLALPLSFLLYASTSFRLMYLLERKISFLAACKANSIPQVAHLLVPSRIVEGLRPIYLNRFSEIDLATGFAVTFVERICDVIAICMIFFTLSMLVERDIITFLKLPTLSNFAFLALGLTLALMLSVKLLKSRELKTNLSKNFRLFILSSFKKVNEGFSRRHLTKLIFFTIASWLCNSLLFAVFFNSFLSLGNFLILDIFQIGLLLVVAVLGLNLTITPGGLGTFEFAIGYILSHFGVDLAVGVMLAFTLRLGLIIPPLLFFCWIFRHSQKT